VNVDAKVQELANVAREVGVVLVVGPYGSGKVWMCEHALQRLGLTKMHVDLAVLDAGDLADPSMPEGHGFILDGLQYISDKEQIAQTREYVLKFARAKRTVFIPLPPHPVLFAIVAGWFAEETPPHPVVVEVSK
jgi:hypothetical protein